MDLTKVSVWHSLKTRLHDIVLASTAVLTMLLVLFWGENIGLSDNGDFARVMNACSLSVIEQDKAFYFIDHYAITLSEASLPSNAIQILFSPDGISNYPNIQILFVRLTVVLNLLWNVISGSEPSTYRLSVLAVFYVIAYGWSIYLLFRRSRLKKIVPETIAKIFCIIILCDVGYITYFNSFFSEPLQIIGLILSVATGLNILQRSSLRVRDHIAFSLSTILYGWSKSANIPVSILFMIIVSGISFLKSRQKTALISGILALSAMVGIYTLTPDWMDYDTNFNSVFYGIIKDTDEAISREYLTNLGLDPEMAQYAGNNAYVVGVADGFAQQGYRTEFEDNVSKFTLLGFYLRHPTYLLEKVELSISHSGMIRPFYLSNHGKDSPRFVLSHRFSLWSNVRQTLGFDTVPGNLAILFCALLLIIIYFRKSPSIFMPICISLLGAWCYHLLIPYICNGSGDLAKHMFAFIQIVDIMVVGIIIALANPEKQSRTISVSVISLCILCLIAPPIQETLYNEILERTHHDQLEQGAYVQFGTQNDQSVTWLVADITEDGTGILLSVESFDAAVYSEENSNLWTTSDLRNWLNDGFLDSFSAEHRSILKPTDQTVLLSVAHKELAASGSHDFYCSHLPKQLAVGSARSYSLQVKDAVSLPDLDLVMSLSQQGYLLANDEPYWLQGAYFNNGYMVRCFYPDGMVYFQESKESLPVRPVICVDMTKLEEMISSGSGSLKDPFS